MTWNEDGVYSATTICVADGLTATTCGGVTGLTTLQESVTAITITTQHFDKGNENIEMDMTAEVNSLITGGTDNDGYGIAFRKSTRRDSDSAFAICRIFYSSYTNIL